MSSTVEAVIQKAKAHAEVSEYMKGLRRAIRSAGLVYSRDGMTFGFPTEDCTVTFTSTSPVLYELTPGSNGFAGARISGGTAAERAERKGQEPKERTPKERKPKGTKGSRAKGIPIDPEYATPLRERGGRDTLIAFCNDIITTMKLKIAEKPGAQTWLTFNAQQVYQAHEHNMAAIAWLQARIARRNIHPTHLAMMSIGDNTNFLVGFGPIANPHSFHEDVEPQEPRRELLPPQFGGKSLDEVIASETQEDEN